MSVTSFGSLQSPVVFALLISDGFGIWVSGLHGLKDEAVWSFKVWGFRVVYDCKAALAAIYTVYTYVYIYICICIYLYIHLCLFICLCNIRLVSALQ